MGGCSGKSEACLHLLQHTTNCLVGSRECAERLEATRPVRPACTRCSSCASAGEDAQVLPPGQHAANRVISGDSV